MFSSVGYLILAINLRRDRRVSNRHLALNFFPFREKPLFSALVLHFVPAN